MASKETDDPSNHTAETDQETIAIRRKRLRRVSFADREITSVHIFNRDEDYETPPSASKPTNSVTTRAVELENESPGFFRDLADSDDSPEFLCPSPDEEDGLGGEAVAGGRLFLRPRGSPSSGGSTIGSATSNDEENFFGPVSAHFIRPGRLSDAAASDDNHDVTMDSTAFSMHFQSLVRSEAGDLKTPTRNQLDSEEKTPFGNSYTPDTDNIMVLTEAKIANSPLPVGKVSGGKDSNDMSLVGDNPHKFDYGRLSPRLQALLAEEDKDFVAASNPAGTEARSPAIVNSVSHKSWINGSGQNYHGYGEKFGFNSRDVLAAGAFSELAKEKEMPYKMTSPPSMLHAESPAIDGTPIAKNYEGQYEMDIHRESSSQHDTENQSKLYSARQERQNSSNGHQLKSPLLGSIASSAIREQVVSLGNENTSLSYVTPSPKQHGSFLNRKSFELVKSLSTIQKSKSRIKLTRTASPASALMNRIQKSKLTLSGYLSSTATPAATGRKEDDRNLWIKPVDVLITNLEEELSNVDPKNLPNERSINLRRDGSDSKSSDVDAKSLPEDSLSLNDVYAGIFQDKSTNLTTTAISKEDDAYCLGAKNPTEGRLLVNSDSLPGEITFDCRNSEQAVNTPKKFTSRPENGLNTERMSTTDNAGLQWDEQLNGSVSRSIAEEENLTENDSRGGLTGKLNKVYSGFTEASSTSSDVNCLSGSAQLKPEDTRGSPLLQTLARNTGSLLSPSKSRDTREFHSGSLSKNRQIATNVACSNEELPLRVMEEISGASVSSFVEQSNSKLQAQKLNSSTPLLTSSIRKSIPSSPSSHLHNKQQDENIQIEEGELSPEPEVNRSIGDEEHKGSINPLSYTESSTRLKRKNQNNDHLVKSIGAERSPKALKGEHVYEVVQDHFTGDMERGKSIRARAELTDWSDVSRKLLANTHEFLAPLAAELSFNLIGILEEVLQSLKKVHLREALCSEISSQKAYDKLSRDKNKRHTETKLLLYKIAYEKAKQHLLQLRRERLLKNIQIVSSRSQGINILEANFRTQQCQGGERDAQADDSPHSSCSENHEVAGKRILKEQEFEDLDTKINSLTKSLHIYCKMQGDPTYLETIAFLKNRLRKNRCCGLIRQNMLLWGVDALRSRNCINYIVLSYSDFVNQRLTIKPGSVSTLLISNKVNDTVVGKYLPNVDAHTAFTAVFNFETTNKYLGSKTLAQESQTTSLLLCNLLDVLEELQRARMELQNLVCASFDSPSAGQLYLELSFIDCRIIGKVIVILDISCLTRGIYPSDIVPCKLLKAYADGAKTPLPESRSLEINSSLDNVGVGYPRITKLCSRISQVLR